MSRGRAADCGTRRCQLPGQCRFPDRRRSQRYGRPCFYGVLLCMHKLQPTRRSSAYDTRPATPHVRFWRIGHTNTKFNTPHVRFWGNGHSKGDFGCPCVRFWRIGHVKCVFVIPDVRFPRIGHSWSQTNEHMAIRPDPNAATHQPAIAVRGGIRRPPNHVSSRTILDIAKQKQTNISTIRSRRMARHEPNAISRPCNGTR